MQWHNTKLKQSKSESSDFNKIDLIHDPLQLDQEIEIIINEDEEENIELIELNFTNELSETSETNESHENNQFSENIEKITLELNTEQKHFKSKDLQAWKIRGDGRKNKNHTIFHIALKIVSV